MRGGPGQRPFGWSVLLDVGIDDDAGDGLVFRPSDVVCLCLFEGILGVLGGVPGALVAVVVVSDVSVDGTPRISGRHDSTFQTSLGGEPETSNEGNLASGV